MRLDIRYRMSFRYDLPVWEAQNEIRVRPQDRDDQRVIAYRLTPAPVARVMSFIDYWGTTVDHVGVREPHLELELVAEAAVDTTVQSAPIGDAPLSALDDGFARSMTEFLQPSNHVAWTPGVVELAHGLPSTETVLELVDTCVDSVHESLDYVKGATEIGVTLDQLVAGGQGVCQDYAHLTIGLLRCRGVPARYVSGYLFAADETSLGDDDSDEPVRVQTHAWVEAAVPGQGWKAVDPTNQRPVGPRHVVIGVGRDYDDVAPVRGVFMGPGTPTVDAEVEIRRMDAAPRTTTFERPARLNAAQVAEIRRRRQQQQQQQ